MARFPATVATVVVVVALAVSGRAAAQIATPDPGIYAPDYASLINQATFLRQGMRPVTPRERARPTPPRPATKRELRLLRYVSRPAVTRALAPRLVARLANGFDAPWDASFQDDIRRNVVTGAYRRGFAAGMRELGGRQRNLADASSVATLMLFGAHELDGATAPRLNVRGARRFILDNRQATAKNPRLRKQSDAAKQREAETLGTIAMHALTFQVSMYALAAQGDEQARFAAGYLDRNRQLVRNLLRSRLHFDVTAYRLTAKGFVRR